MKDNTNKINAYCNLAPALKKFHIGNPERLWKEAISLTRTIRREDPRDEALCQIVVGLIKVGKLNKAKQITSKINNEEWYAFSLGDVASAIAVKGNKKDANELWKKAFAIAKSKNINDRQRYNILTYLAATIIRSGDIKRGLKISKNLKWSTYRHALNEEINNYYMQRGDLNGAIRAIKTIQGADSKITALLITAKELYMTGKIQKAKRLWSEAIKETRGAKPADMRIWYLTGIARSMTDAGDKSGAEELMVTINKIVDKDNNSSTKSLSYIAIAYELDHNNKNEDVKKIIKEIIRLGESIKDECNRDTYRINLIQLLGNIGDISGAIKILRKFKRKEEREIQYSNLVEILCSRKEYDEALGLFNKMSIEWHKTRVIQSIVECIMKNHSTEK